MWSPVPGEKGLLDKNEKKEKNRLVRVSQKLRERVKRFTVCLMTIGDTWRPKKKQKLEYGGILIKSHS